MYIYYIAGFPISDELYHYGILGQKWGVRRFQNPDGTLTPAGRERYTPSNTVKVPGVSFENEKAIKRSLKDLNYSYLNKAIDYKYYANNIQNLSGKDFDPKTRHGSKNVDDFLLNTKKAAESLNAMAVYSKLTKTLAKEIDDRGIILDKESKSYRDGLEYYNKVFNPESGLQYYTTILETYLKN